MKQNLRKENMEDTNVVKVKKYVIRAILGVVGVILFFNSLGTIGAGERGVRTRFGAVSSGILGEGLYVKIPFAEKVQRMDVKIQKDQTDATSASKDLQDVSTTIAVNYHLEPTRVADIYQNVGVSYRKDTTVADRLISPALQESVKASTAKFTAEELITKREEVRDNVKQILVAKMEPRGIVIDELNIINFNLSPSFNAAIEAKVTAEQNALAAKNKLSQIQYEAQQAVAEADGKAKAITVEAQALRDNPQVLELRALEKWNGVLPQVTGNGGVPFITIK
jgi:regulator of protease activity HflC (stomatin/prohibitin superfamily)